MLDLEVSFASGGHDCGRCRNDVALVIAPNKCSDCCFIGSVSDGVIALVS
jgi:hypothetical protein